ncbi:MAG TPA: SDR family oxidoreductase [Ktedonobacteraceae bacterium]
MQNEQLQATDLRGKVAIVTGASSGIGEAVAEELVRRDVHVALFARRVDRLQALAQRLAGQGNEEPLIVPGDVSKPEDVQNLVNQTAQRWGKLDIIIANAGFGYRAPIVDGDPQRWKNLLDTNVYGLLLTLKYGVEKLLKHGSGDVVVTSSVAGRAVTAGGAVYSASKFAVNAIAEALREEVGQQGIRVTTLEPGAVETEFAEVAGYPPGTVEAIKQLDPLQAKEIALIVIQVLEQPRNVDIAELTVYPTKQISLGIFANAISRQP